MSTITPLFPTLLLTLNYPPPKDLVDYCDTYYQEKKYTARERSNRLGWQSKPHIIKELGPVLGQIDRHTYTKPLIHGQAWININPTHGYNVSHIHPNSDYTFVYYLTDDNVDIHLQHPHVYEQHNHYLSLQQQYKEQYPSGHIVSITPNKGDILMFPSYIPHFVDSNNKSSKRVSISWNSDVKDLPRVWRDTPPSANENQ